MLGTQNPIEMEGTYPLPEAQIDRFLFKLDVDYLSEEELLQVVDRTTADTTPEINAVLKGEEVIKMRTAVRQVAVADHVKRYAVRLVSATHPGSHASTKMVNRFLKLGSSPRGAQGLMLAGKVRALSQGPLPLVVRRRPQRGHGNAAPPLPPQLRGGGRGHQYGRHRQGDPG